MQPIARNGIVAAIASLLLAGCAAFSPDGGMSFVVDTAGHELRKDVAAIRTEDDANASREAVARLLKRPLTADAAVQIALLNNRGLQAAYAELGIAEARMVAASLPPSPTLSVSRLAGAGPVEIEGRLLGDILALATLPARSETARKRFRQAQLRAAEETFRLAQEAACQVPAVASHQLVGYPARRRLRRIPPPSSRNGLAAPAPSTSSIRRGNRRSMRKPPRNWRPPGRPPPATASGSFARWVFGAAI